MERKNVRKKNYFDKEYFICEVYYKSDDENCFIGYVAEISRGAVEFEVELVALSDKYKERYEKKLLNMGTIHGGLYPDSFTLKRIFVISTTEDIMADILQGLIEMNFKE